MKMNYKEFNLRQLLEFALRYPEVGAVNFNIIYLILKTIIKKQGIETLTPQITFSSSEYEKDSASKENDSKTSKEDDKEEKAEKMDEMEKKLAELSKTVEHLQERNSELESQAEQKGKETSSEIEESLSDEETSSSPITTKSSEEKVKETSSSESEKSGKPTESVVEQLLPSTFSWHKDVTLSKKCEEMKKKFESLKEKDQKAFWIEMVTLEEQNKLIVKKFDELHQDFDTVMNRFSKLSILVEELDKNVQEKIKVEDDVQQLKVQIDRLDAYVYTGEKEREEKMEKVQVSESASKPEMELEEHFEFVRGEVEKTQPTKERKANFAKMVKNVLRKSEKGKVDIKTKPAQLDAKKVKPTTMKKIHEEVIEDKLETPSVKMDPEVEAKEWETAEKLEMDQLPMQEETTVDELVVSEQIDPLLKGPAQRKFQTAAQGITLLQNMHKTQYAKKIAKARKNQGMQNTDEPEEMLKELLSAESVEIPDHPAEEVTPEEPKSAPGKATLLIGNDKAFQELKERVVMYVKTSLEEMEEKFMDQMHAVETSIAELQEENETLREEMHDLKTRLANVEINQNKFEGKFTVVEEKTNLNDLHIEEMMIALDKKADRTDALTGVTRKDLSILEDRMLQINETTLSDIDGMRKFLKGYTVKMRDEFEEKVSGFDMDCRLEPLAGRLKRLEKLLKEISITVRVLECQSMGPIEVRRYMHCEDGKRVKPLKRPISHWTSATQSETSALFCDDIFFDEENAEKIAADVQKRLEDAVFRDSKHLIGGAHTKVKVAKT